jgi:hypothetical protein
MTMTTLQRGDQVRVIAPRSHWHHQMGRVQHVQDANTPQPTVAVKLDVSGTILYCQPRALVLVVP